MERQQPDPIRDDSPDELRRLAQQYQRNGQYLPALRIYDALIGAGKADAATWREAGNALSDVGEYAQASEAFRHGLSLNAADAEAHNNRSRALYRLGDMDGACHHLRQAIALGDSFISWQNLATIIPACPGADLQEILDVRQAFATQLAAQVAAQTQPTKPAPCRPRPTSGPLRIGYLCAFFHSANYMKPVWGLINHHDRTACSLHLLSDSPPEQGLPGYQPQTADWIHDIRSLDNRQLSELVSDLGIDIVVDLNGYSVPERLGFFVCRPSAIVVAWFNTFATTGLPCVDYVIGDDEVVRDVEMPYFCETVVRLPLSYLTFEVAHSAPPVQPPPCVSRGHVTFGSLVSQYKITGAVLDAWGEILRDAPEARLLLANATLKSPQNRQYVQEQFLRRGVAAHRLELLGPAEHYRYLQYYDQVDIALDAFPYNGGTTTMEALWQGVPVLTFDGDRWASRTSQTLIRRTPWSRFVAASLRGYVQHAVRLGTSEATPSELASLRPAMREQLQQSSACDTAGLAASMEAIFRDLVRPTPQSAARGDLE